jgi:ATP-dependent DNA ligase
MAPTSSVFLYAFDLIELNGDDLHRDPPEVRKTTLASVLAKAGAGIRLNEHLEHEDSARPCSATPGLKAPQPRSASPAHDMLAPA